RLRQLMRFPSYQLRFARLPRLFVGSRRIECFELASGGLGVMRSKLLLQYCDNSVVPGIMEILLLRHYTYHLANTTPVRIRCCMQRLMNVADEMDQECEVAGGAPFVIVAITKPSSVLVNFRSHTIPVRAPRR